MENIEIISELITGRVKPHIYAFSTNTIPNYLKVGDTYRALPLRLNEWRKHFANLTLEYSVDASISEDIFFRDYAVHDYLINELGKQRLLIEDMKKFPPGTYYSREFFKDTASKDVQLAVEDIRQSYKNNDNKYQFYNAAAFLPETHTYISTGYWKPRPNQQEAIDNFVKAVAAGRNNLLMYAVMRFGKSFTAMCCAKEKGFKTVLVVSAKADVREEWRKTVQSADNFNKDYVFLSSDDLLGDENAIINILNKGMGAVIFLTLQDLQGKEIKEKHKGIFENKMDLLIIDETHYGARAESYGRVIRTANTVNDINLNLTYEGDDSVDPDEADKQLKELKVKVKLHLSGTPYRILMGSEFSKEDIISFCQFSDIAAEQKSWDKQHILHEGAQYTGEDGDKYQEWDNPYFGFPQMIRFAFMPNESSLKTLEGLKKKGSAYSLSELLRPVSVRRCKSGEHKKFVYEREVLDLFEAIDGSKDDDSIFAFLDYDKIRDGKMCRHMVIVLPYCASCDALEEILRKNKPNFKNLGEYEIINISGVDSGKTYKTVQFIKDKIKNCEEKNKKTITLTVNRMLTGSTVEQWDTMIFLKDTASPQEYDQAVFRLQNQYVRSFKNESGEEIKYNMKPQTLLVDFDPHRMFIMQEQKSLIYNVNTEEVGNRHLKDRMAAELAISPIITINKGKIHQVDAADIMAAVSEYSNSRGVRDEAGDIPVDDKLFEIDYIRSEIERQAELGSKGGLKAEAYSGSENDMEIPDSEENDSLNDSRNDTNKDGADIANGIGASETLNKLQILRNKFKTYYSRILFFAYLTNEKAVSLSDILRIAKTDDGKRIMKNLDIDVNVLRLISTHMYPFILTALDYKIQNINALSHDETIPALDRAVTAMGKFGKLSESEVTTPINTASEIIKLIPDDAFANLTDNKNYILDLASKMGEFAIAVYNRCSSLGMDVSSYKNKIIAIPTSPVAYEFTRKVYSILGLAVSCVVNNFTSYDLLKVSTDKIIEEAKKVKFNAIVGNPPYQEEDGGASASAKPIYPEFVNISRKLAPSYASIIIPARWYAGGKGGKEMTTFRKSMINDTHIRELHDCRHPEEIFPDTNNRGGVCYFLWDKDFDSNSEDMTVVTHSGNNVVKSVKRKLKTANLDIFVREPEAVEIIRKVTSSGAEMMNKHISPRKPYGIESNIIKTEHWKSTQDGLKCPLKCVGKRQSYGYVEKSLVTSHREWVDIWKVFTPRANNIGTELADDNLNTFVGEPGTICTEAYIALGIDLNLTEDSAENLAKYFNTKFVRYMHGLAKASHDASSRTYRFVPAVDFDEEWTDEKLYKKFGLSEEEIAHIEESIKEMQ